MGDAAAGGDAQNATLTAVLNQLWGEQRCGVVTPALHDNGGSWYAATVIDGPDFRGTGMGLQHEWRFLVEFFDSALSDLEYHGDKCLMELFVPSVPAVYANLFGDEEDEDEVRVVSMKTKTRSMQTRGMRRRQRLAHLMHPKGDLPNGYLPIYGLSL